MAGFIDIHCHGGGNLEFMDASVEEMKEIAKFHLKKGTTTLYATTMTDTWRATEASLDTYAALEKTGELYSLEGVHLEGPWLAPAQCGAQSVEKMDLPTNEKLDYLLSKYPFIKRITMAPELPLAMEVGKRASEGGVVVSAGHTDADFDTTLEALDHGYTLLTHLYSGMSGLYRKNSYRYAGAIEAGLYSDKYYVEIIADGKHLPSSLLKLIYKCCTSDRICLITDAIRGAGLPDGTETISGRLEDGLPIIIEDGVGKVLDRQCFAGSVATSDRLIRTMHNLAGVDLINISKMASATPAKVMGLCDRGTIEIGKRADLVLMNENLETESVYLKGELVI